MRGVLFVLILLAVPATAQVMDPPLELYDPLQFGGGEFDDLEQIVNLHVTILCRMPVAVNPGLSETGELAWHFDNVHQEFTIEGGGAEERTLPNCQGEYIDRPATPIQIGIPETTPSGRVLVATAQATLTYDDVGTQTSEPRTVVSEATDIYTYVPLRGELDIDIRPVDGASLSWDVIVSWHGNGGAELIIDDNGTIVPGKSQILGKKDATTMRIDLHEMASCNTEVRTTTLRIVDSEIDRVAIEQVLELPPHHDNCTFTRGGTMDRVAPPMVALGLVGLSLWMVARNRRLVNP